MSEPFAPPPEPPAPPPGPFVPPPEPPAEPPAARSRAGAFLLFVTLFGVGFVGVLAVILLRAPDDAAGPRIVLQPPAGYVLLDDARSGGGRLDESRAAAVLGQRDVPGFRAGLLRAWGRRPGEPPRSVVLLGIELRSAEQAEAVRRAYLESVLRRGATSFGTPGLDGNGFHDVPDRAGRHAQRVVFTRGARLFVVSVVTPERETDTGEVVRLATRQAAIG